VVFIVLLVNVVTSQYYAEHDVSNAHYDSQNLPKTEGTYGSSDSSKFQTFIKPSPLSYEGSHVGASLSGYGASSDEFYVGKFFA